MTMEAPHLLTRDDVLQIIEAVSAWAVRASRAESALATSEARCAELAGALEDVRRCMDAEPEISEALGETAGAVRRALAAQPEGKGPQTDTPAGSHSTHASSAEDGNSACQPPSAGVSQPEGKGAATCPRCKARELPNLKTPCPNPMCDYGSPFPPPAGPKTAAGKCARCDGTKRVNEESMGPERTCPDCAPKCGTCGGTKWVWDKPCPACNGTGEGAEKTIPAEQTEGWQAVIRSQGAEMRASLPQSPGGLAAIVGKWPGDETDEQVAEAMGEPLPQPPGGEAGTGKQGLLADTRLQCRCEDSRGQSCLRCSP